MTTNLTTRANPKLAQSALWLLAIALCAAGLAAPAVAVEAARPNVLFIFADDFAFDCVHATGNGQIETPNLDRLVARGTTFTHAYNQGSWSGAVCVASRTMLNTGRYLWHAHQVYKTSEAERSAGRFWSEYLKRAGYETYMTGKWHVPANAAKAFDHTVHIRPGMPKQTKEGYNRPHEGQPDPWSPSDPRFGGFWEGGRHWSAVVADDGATFLKDAAGREKPFFMYLAFNAPHDPRQSPQEFVDKYPVDTLQLPESFLPEYPFKDAAGCGKNLRDEKLAPFPRTEYAAKVNRREYYALITHLDVQVGRILEVLEQSGQADSTYIFFTADHGLAVGHHGLMGKQNLFDHSVRVPFVAVGPRIEAARIAAPIYLQDVMPTTLELAGIDKPAHVEFHSLLPLLRGETADSAYEAIYGAYLAVQRSVVVGKYKLILYPKISQVLLFDLEQDPLEMRNLAESEEFRPVVKRLFKRLRRLQKETGDELDLRTPFAELAREFHPHLLR